MNCWPYEAWTTVTLLHEMSLDRWAVEKCTVIEIGAFRWVSIMWQLKMPQVSSPLSQIVAFVLKKKVAHPRPPGNRPVRKPWLKPVLFLFSRLQPFQRFNHPSFCRFSVQMHELLTVWSLDYCHIAAWNEPGSLGSGEVYSDWEIYI